MEILADSDLTISHVYRSLFEVCRNGQQFHQYQQNKQSLLTITHCTLEIGTTTYDIGNPGPC